MATRIAPSCIGKKTAEYASLSRRTRSPFLSGRDWRQFKYTAVFCGFGDFTFAQRQTDSVEPFCIFQRKIRRPAGVVLYEFDRDFSRVAALMNEFDGSSDHLIFRLIKSDDHRSCSGR